MKLQNLTHILIGIVCFALLPTAQAVSPPPDGSYPGYTTAEGTNALQNLTTGLANTGLGCYALFTGTTGNYNTAVGAGALVLNNADANTATGAAALLLNTTGNNNTANGAAALVHNTTGTGNTANGAFALASNTEGSNTAIGDSALFSNTTGDRNTAVGANALNANITGNQNVASGDFALFNNIGDANTADGSGALLTNTTGGTNTATGFHALYNNTTGGSNIALGNNAGLNLTTGDNNIDVGNQGVADEANTIRIGHETVQTATYIAGISGQTASGGVAVFIDADGKLGTLTSSARFKTEIKPMDKASEMILALKPVSFQYKSDCKGTPQFGLIAEDVAQVNPDLVVRDRNGEIYSVRYEAVNAMLLNEFLKEHSKVEKLEAKVAQQKRDFRGIANQQQQEIKALSASLNEQASQIQKVSAQLELNKPAPQTVLNNQ